MLDRVTERLGFPLDHHRRFVAAIAIDAVGSGVFMPVSMLPSSSRPTCRWSRWAPPSPWPRRSPCRRPPDPGGLVDRYGAKRLLLAGNLLQFVGFLAWSPTVSPG